MKEDKTPKEYKVISGSTVFVLKKLIRGDILNTYQFTTNFYVDDKSESSQKTKSVRLPEFTELLRHERMQDLVREWFPIMIHCYEFLLSLISFLSQYLILT